LSECIVAKAKNGTPWVTSHEFAMGVTLMHWRRSTEAGYDSSSHEIGRHGAEEFAGNDYFGISQNAGKYHCLRVIE
jgi:hypothetical protein